MTKTASAHNDEMIEMIEIWLRQPDGSWTHEIRRMSDWLEEHRCEIEDEDEDPTT